VQVSADLSTFLSRRGTSFVQFSPLGNLAAGPLVSQRYATGEASLDVENAFVAPAVLVVANQVPLGVGRQGSLPGAR
jgi:hypothetical protein